MAYGEFSASSPRSPTARRSCQKSVILEAHSGDAPDPAQAGKLSIDERADVVAWAHNETSTGVMAPVVRPAAAAEALLLIDATSGAGGLPFDAREADVYYFAPQKSFAADGGLWLALLSPAAVERIERIARERPLDSRFPPRFATALENSRKDQTYNTPAVATLILLLEQVALDEHDRRSADVRRTHRRQREGPLRLGRAHELHDTVR